MNFDVRYANHPEDSKRYDTAQLRKHYHIARVFTPDEINLTYSHQDRIIAGGIMPVEQALVLEETTGEHIAYAVETIKTIWERV